jgi:hypothetical protein
LRRTLLVIAGVLAALVAGGFALDRLAAPQDLPWRPFDLDQPVGLATHFKLARIGADEARCRAALAAGGIDFQPVPPRRDGRCNQLAAGRFGAGLAPLDPPRAVLTCREALAFAVWERHVVQPAARRDLGAGVSLISHFGTYACRPIRGERAQLSEHAFADAIDVSAFRLSDRREISVLHDYRAPTRAGTFLRDVHAGGCRIFGHTLGPDFNAAHRDHFHLDMGASPWGLCR